MCYVCVRCVCAIVCMCVTGVCILRDLLAMALSLTAMKLDAALATCLRAHVTRKGSAALDPAAAPATSHYGPLESKNSKLNYPESREVACLTSS